MLLHFRCCFFFDQIPVLGGLVSAVNAIMESGRNVVTFTIFMSDGEADHDDTRYLPELNALVGGLLETNNHIICGIALGSQAAHAFRQMGIPDKWIKQANDPVGFKELMLKVSQFSRGVSQGGAGTFQHAAQEGFR